MWGANRRFVTWFFELTNLAAVVERTVTQVQTSLEHQHQQHQLIEIDNTDLETA
jgi:hypothetical protein